MTIIIGGGGEREAYFTLGPLAEFQFYFDS